MPRPLAPCGTRSAYARHKRLNEPVDEACAEANRARQRKSTSGQRSAPEIPEGPQWRCELCGGREQVEYPVDDVALRMAKIRHYGANRDCHDAALRASLVTAG